MISKINDLSHHLFLNFYIKNEKTLVWDVENSVGLVDNLLKIREKSGNFQLPKKLFFLMSFFLFKD